jgi:hypothetical protein
MTAPHVRDGEERSIHSSETDAPYSSLAAVARLWYPLGGGVAFDVPVITRTKIVGNYRLLGIAQMTLAPLILIAVAPILQ